MRMREQLDGVAFDLDGTLYPGYRLYIRLIPFLLKESKLLWAMGKARDILRKEEAGEAAGSPETFYELQARLMAEILREEPPTVRERTERLIYRGWEPLFKEIRVYAHVRETLDAFRKEGLKLGLLSDFPPERKLEYLGLTGLWDTVLCSETSGRLKPDPRSFGELARGMGLSPERILYVGNSLSYDIAGARKAGMRTALILSKLKKKRRSPPENADFVFSDYRQLWSYVLQ
jgi:putative hydrolase of the HAD superfamily